LALQVRAMGRGDGTCTLEALQWIGVAVERRRWAGRSMRSLHGAAVDCGDSTRSGLECVKVSGSGEDKLSRIDLFICSGSSLILA
jgi:hypothetical protein